MTAASNADVTAVKLLLAPYQIRTKLIPCEKLSLRRKEIEMRVIGEGEMVDWLANRGWKELPSGRVHAQFPVTVFTGTFDTSATVAADMASLLLCELIEDQISSGSLHVFRIFPFEEPAIKIFQQFLELYGIPAVAYGNFRFEFANEFSSLLFAVTWCMACGWEFNFVGGSNRFAITTDDDGGFVVQCGIDERLKANVPELVKSLEFKAIAP